MPTGPGRNAFRFPYDKYDDRYALNANFRYLQDYMLRGNVNDAFAATHLLSAPNSSNSQRAEYQAQPTDAHTTIQSALDDLPVAGGELAFLEGTYNLSGTVTFPDKPVVLRAIGKATLNIAAGTSFVWDGDEQVVMDGFTFTGGAEDMNLMAPKGDFWFVNNLVDTFTVRWFMHVTAVGQFARFFVTDNLFRDVTIDGTDGFTQHGILIMGSGGSRGGEAVVANNHFRNIIGDSVSAEYITYCAGTDRPVAVSDNVVELSSTLTDYFGGITDLVSHNVIDGVASPGSHNLGVSDLNDATVTGTPADNEVFAFDTGTGEWINQTAAEAALAAAVHAHVEADISDLDHTDATAIHDNVAAEISAITEKVSPVSADLVIIEDSAASNAKKKVQIGNLAAVSDHGALTGLGDDDHTQYLTEARHVNEHASGRWRRSTVQAITNNTFTTVVFNTAAFEDDVDGDISFNTGTGVLTVNTAGVYEFMVGVSWESNGAGFRQLALRHNDTTYISADLYLPIAQAQTTHSTLYKMAATDTMRFHVRQTSGGNLNIGGDELTFFAVRKL